MMNDTMNPTAKATAKHAANNNKRLPSISFPFGVYGPDKHVWSGYNRVGTYEKG